MPRLTYTPEGADPKVWDFAFGRLLSPERIAIEKMTGLGWQGVQRGFYGNQGSVIHAVLYVLLKRDLPALRAEEVVFCDDEIGLDLTDTEASEALAALRAQSSLTDEEIEAVRHFEERFAGDKEADAPKEE